MTTYASNDDLFMVIATNDPKIKEKLVPICSQGISGLSYQNHFLLDLIRHLNNTHNNQTSTLIIDTKLPIDINTTRITNQRWQLNKSLFLLIAPNGSKIHLTYTETQLLNLMINNKLKPVSRLKISESLGSVYRFSGNALEAMISRLRKKISQKDSITEPIKAVHGIGYLLTLDIAHVDCDLPPKKPSPILG